MSGAGYAFIPLPPDARRVPRGHAVFHKRVPGTLSGHIGVTLVTEQPVHVGSGSKRAERGRVVERSAVIRGLPGIPGSSLKGVLRSRYEAMTRSCAGSPPRSGKVESRTHPQIKKAEFTADITNMPVFHPVGSKYRDHGCNPQQSCPACTLFGCMSLRSRVTVTDCMCTEPMDFTVRSMAERFSPRVHHVGQARIVPGDHGGGVFEIYSLHGRKFAVGIGPVADPPKEQRVETIPPDACLVGQIRVWNLMPYELGGLLAALGRLPASVLKLGGGKARGFGRMRCTSATYRLIDHTGNPVAADEAAWQQAFAGSPDHFAEGERCLVRLHEGEC